MASQLPRMTSNRSRVPTAVTLGFALALIGVLLVRVGLVNDPTNPEGSHEQVAAASNFGLANVETPDKPDAKFINATVLTPRRNFSWFGTYINGDAFTGHTV